MNNKKNISVVLSVLILSVIILSVPSTSRAAPDIKRSIVGDYLNKVFSVSLTDGSGILDSEDDIKEREEINNSIYNDTAKINYSLYDRFGGNIRFIPYFGETIVSTNVADLFYTAYISNDRDFDVSAADIVDAIKNPALSNSVVYNNRPRLLSKQDIKEGGIDPRVYAYSGISQTGGDAALGNSMLGVSKIITEIVSWMSGINLYESLNNVWNKVMKEDGDIAIVLKSFVGIILPLAIAGFVIRLVISSRSVLNGTFGMKKMVENLVSSAVSIAIVFSLMNNPLAFSSTLTSVTTIIDKTLDSSLNIKADEVSRSDLSKNIRTATLWRKTVLDPWSEGMFGREYKRMYTEFTSMPEDQILQQSKDNVKESWTEGTIKYNSSALTGDIGVKLGKKLNIKNWAALAWSTGSIYHIDAVKNEDTVSNGETEALVGKNTWPKALVTLRNDSIYVDNFRWIDAYTNISPEYISPDDINFDYTNSRPYKQFFISSGLRSMYLSFLLFPIFLLSLRKIKYIVLIVTTGIRLLSSSIINLIMPDKYNIGANIISALKPLYEFVWWSFIVFISIVLFNSMAGKSLLSDVIWLFLGLYLLKMTPTRTPRMVREALNSAKRGVRNSFMKLGKR